VMYLQWLAIFLLCTVVIILVMKISYMNDDIAQCKEGLGEMLTTDHLGIFIANRDKSMDDITRELKDAGSKYSSFIDDDEDS